MTVTDRPAALVAANDSNGALAAVRDLGREGVPVLVPRPSFLSPVRFSRYISEKVEQNPPAGVESSATTAWLLRIGRKHPGTVLMPSLDSLTWEVATHGGLLGRYFRAYYPAPRVLYGLLNKRHLHEAAVSAGLDVPDAWFPGSFESLDQIAPRLPYPVVIKPAAHLRAPHWLKGWLAHDADELRATYRHAAARLGVSMASGFSGDEPWPFVQAYQAGAGRRIYNIAGFTDETGELRGYGASMKLLQYPQRFGVGLCFRAAPVDRELAARLTELLRSTGFFGIFEAEFIEAGGKRLFIDFNPRVFNGMGLAGSRGLRLALTWYLAALGDWAAVEEQLAASRPFEDGGGSPDAWCHRTGLQAMIAARLFTKRMPFQEARRLQKWVRSDHRRVVDSNWASDDPWPGRMAGLQQMAKILRDPRYFVGTFVRD